MSQQSTTSHGLPGANRAGHRPGHIKAVILAAVSLGQFMIQMDLTVVNVALPAIGHHLHGLTSGLQWVIDGYSLALASLLLLGGRIGDRSGHKRVYLAGLAIFGVGSGLCALASSMGALICFRVLQGIGAAVELPATLAILSHVFTGQRERAQAVGIWAGAAGTSLVIGPVLGGTLTAAFGWRAIFIVNLPVIAIVAVLTLVTVTEAVGPGGRLDLPGQVLGAATLALLAAGAIEGGQHGFGSGLALGLFAGGAASLAVFVTVEWAGSDPVLPLGFFRNAAYCAANGDGLVMGFVTFGILFLYALFFQQVQGDTPVAAGLRFVPLTIAFVITGPLVGRVIGQLGHGAPMAARLHPDGGRLPAAPAGACLQRLRPGRLAVRHHRGGLRADLHADGRRRAGSSPAGASRHGVLHQPHRQGGRRRVRRRRSRRPAAHRAHGQARPTMPRSPQACAQRSSSPASQPWPAPARPQRSSDPDQEDRSEIPGLNPTAPEGNAPVNLADGHGSRFPARLCRWHPTDAADSAYAL